MSDDQPDTAQLRNGKTFVKGPVGNANDDYDEQTEVSNSEEDNLDIEASGAVGGNLLATTEGDTSVDSLKGLMSKFQQMFVKHQLDMSVATTEAVQNAIKGLKKDVDGITGRLSTLERGSIDHGSGTRNDINTDISQNRRRLFNDMSGGTPARKDSFFNDSTENRRGKRVRDWSLKYDGSQKSIPVERFLFRVETLQKRHGISSDELYANFHLLLEGRAQEWYWLYMEEHGDEETQDFENFRKSFSDQFRQADCDEEIRTAMNERKQGYNEAFDEFYAAIRGMAFTMKTKIPEPSLVNIIRRNLRPRIKNLIFGCKIENLEQLKIECRRAEKHLSEFENKSVIKKKIDEVSWENEETAAEREQEGGSLEAFERRTRPFNPSANSRGMMQPCEKSVAKDAGRPTCPCDSPFHRLYCFKCNQSNLKCFLCEKNKAENSKIGDQTGINRPSQSIPERTSQQ